MRHQILRANLIGASLTALLAPFPALGQTQPQVNQAPQLSQQQQAPQFSQQQPPTGLEKNPTQTRAKVDLNQLELQIFNLLQAGKIEEADVKITEALDQARRNKKLDSAILYLAAFSQFKDEKYNAAAAYLKEIQELPAESQPLSLQDQVILQRCIAECYYRQRNTKDALKHYNLALICAGNNDIGTLLRAELEEGLVGCYLLEKRYKEAEAPALILAQLTSTHSNQLSGLCPYFWANVYLAEIYKSLGNKDKHDFYRKNLVGLLVQMMAEREQIENSVGAIPLQGVRDRFLKDYMDDTQPQTLGEYLWLATTFKLKTLPIIAWQSRAPENRSKATIIAVHGMGLDNRAFTPFAHEMRGRGYTIFAIDVRGFGSWMNASGNEKIDYKDSFTDINNMVGLIKEHNPSAPVFLLGESMGGAIALNTAAQFGQNLRGVIASVPSAERLQAKRMSLTVALHFLNGPDKPFNVGTQIAAQATAKPEMRAMWANSLKAKNELSPKELMNFAIFMRRTHSHCGDIKTLPVLMVQGLKDKLVKPQGTYDLFDAVKSEDKTMMIVGNAEHLIFETDSQNGVVIDTLCSWIDKHSADNSPSQMNSQTQLPTQLQPNQQLQIKSPAGTNQ
ncbi:alpha/beta fold hydrolase [bacterium]|nr:alpha/beta fold hydrolase [bacterium]